MSNYVELCHCLIFHFYYKIYVGLASVLKNYAEHEKIIMQMSLTTRDIDSLAVMNSCQPSNMKQKSMDHFLKKVFCVHSNDDDALSPILYETSSSGLTELRGHANHQIISMKDFNSLLYAAAKDIDTSKKNVDCAMVILLERYGILNADDKDFATFIMHDLWHNKEIITEGRSEG